MFSRTISRFEAAKAHAMQPPEDSRGTPTGFERGIVGLLAEVNRAAEASMHQLRYVGEWHSHPRRSSPLPSGVDIRQLAWLGSELENERLPALIAIAAAKYGVSARGLHRMMMLESGGRRTAGTLYKGLFQYHPSTWRASWNPWRRQSIFDGWAQIRATAYAIRRGMGPSQWPNTYRMAF